MALEETHDDKPLSIEEARVRVARTMSDLLAGNDPGPMTIRLKPTRNSARRFPLKLTPQQRLRLIHSLPLKRSLKARLAKKREGTKIVMMARKDLEHLNDAISAALEQAPVAVGRQLAAVLRKVTDLLAEEHAELFGFAPPQRRTTTKRQGRPLFQFKITLLDVEPAIWRRIQIPDCTLADFHKYLQAAFGWWDSHLHQFEIDGDHYGPKTQNNGTRAPVPADESEVLLSKLLRKSGEGAVWSYQYDFGDDWRHEILFEGAVNLDPRRKYPRCIDGARACPPEDCGGPPGYAAYLAAIGNPHHEQHQEMLDWYGPFDPEAFTASEVSDEMRDCPCAKVLTAPAPRSRPKPTSKHG